MLELETVQPLLSILNHFHPLEDGTSIFFRKHLNEVNFRKGAYIQKAGKSCDFIYFIRKGAVRGFVKDGSKDITTWISADGELVTSISSLDLDLPALENIQAIEPCDMLAISNTSMTELFERFPSTNITGRKLLQHYYRDAEQRALIARLSSAESKYRFFLEQYRHLANRVQLSYIASYLGITIETLSRVRRKISAGHA